MKRLALIFIFIIFLCLTLLLFKDKAYTQQGTTQVDLLKILDQSYLLNLLKLPALPTSYQQIQWTPMQTTTLLSQNIPNMQNYSFLFANNWNSWQMYNLNPFYTTPSKKKKSESSKEEQSVLSAQETTLDSKIKFSAMANKSIYDKAELIEITLMFENNGSEEVIIEFTSEQKFDVVVKENSGEIIRRLSSDIQYAQPSTTLTLQPGKTKTFYVRWNQEDDDEMIVSSGTYTIDALLSATNAEYQKTVSVTISIKDLPRFQNCKKLRETLKKFWEEIKPPESTSGDGNGEPPVESKSPGKIFMPTGYGAAFYGMGGLYGGYASFGGYGSAGGYGASQYAAPSGFGGAGLTGGYSTSLYGAPAGLGLSGYSSTFGSYAGLGVSGLAGGYSTSLYGAPSGLGLSGYSSTLGSYAGLGLSGFTGYSTSLSGNYGGYSTTSGYAPFNLTSDLQGRAMENSDQGYSITNVQVAGVDEADIIKNDGTYIYMISGNTLQIIQGIPADPLKIVNEINLKGDYVDFVLKRLYVEENTLVLIGEQPVPADSFYSAPPPGTRIFIYDITDRQNEILRRKFIFWGSYVQSRKAGDILYVIMNEPAPLKKFEGTLNNLQVLLPHFYDSYFNGSNENNDSLLCDCDEVAYLNECLSPDYLVVIGIPLDDHTKAIGREVILGKSNMVYATTENLYVTSEYDNGHFTNIYKFWLDDETIAYGSNNQVSGEIINQFGIDKYEDHLRIATTSGSGSGAENNIYIFDSGLKKTGSLEDFTSGGGIQSIRFMDDRCYAVISRDILPLSVISLTDSISLSSLNLVDIFSDTYYLHPIDKNRLLGFGRKIDGGNAEMGIKVSMYDLTDISDPQKIGEDVIGSRHTKSEVLTDHRALLLSMEKNLMAFPITVTEENGSVSYLFQGAYIYDIDDNGFERIDEGVTHYPEGTFPNGSYNNSSSYHINRIIYMGDHYYAVSKGRITAWDILTHTETSSLSLE